MVLKRTIGPNWHDVGAMKCFSSQDAASFGQRSWPVEFLVGYHMSMYMQRQLAVETI
jgi:hypothetical protein